ncbi:MAG: hypothetical protein D6712_05150 [Chloroflexi bacterium]|nr:MAG: hypothetical protein D6712_05150 [Chloroflexota bacterium]
MNEVETKAVDREAAGHSAATAGAGAAAVPAAPVPEEDVITLADIVAIIRENRRLIAWCIGISLLLGVAYALLKTPEYRATVVIKPVSDEGVKSRLGGRIAALADFAAIDLSGGGSEEEYLAILKSRRLARRFIAIHDLKPVLFSNRWDSKRRKWIADRSIYTKVQNFLSRMLTGFSSDTDKLSKNEGAPTDEETYLLFDKKIRHISKDRRTGIVRVTFQFYDRNLVSKWANEYVALANEEIRARTIEEAEKVIGFLSQEADRATDLQLKNAIYNLIQGQLQRIATARARPEYAFRVIDPAVVPEKPYVPKRMLAIVIGGLIGIVLGFVAALVYGSRKGEKSSYI